MKRLAFSSCTLGICAAAILLSGCGGYQSPNGTSGAMPQGALNSTQMVQQRSESPTYEVLTSFYGRRGIEPLGLTIARATTHSTA